MKHGDQIKERQLFSTWLDVTYAQDSQEQYIEELQDQLKEARKALRKAKASVKRVSDAYEKIYGSKPKDSNRAKWR